MSNTRVQVYVESTIEQLIGESSFDPKTIVKPGHYVPRPGVWVGPFPTLADADTWDDATPESLHDKWRRDHLDGAQYQIVKPEDY